ncbi:MAG TPA: L,D-transpeptidase family protein [Blastocatellia bacterium]|nr:L,D-transpeptidase family protein [Blastocatellia bacterium]
MKAALSGTLTIMLVAVAASGCGQQVASAPAPPQKQSQKGPQANGSAEMNESHGEHDGKQPEGFRILVKKGERKLYLYEIHGGRGRLRKTYQIALGNNPAGTKKRQGDGATPEGDYYITHKNPKSNYYLSLGLSYPNITDADEGLKNGLITAEQHRAVVNAIRNYDKPPQNTKLGGDIFIHGGGAGKAFGLIRDWTLGCVALENEDIKELFDTVPVKTQVKILP